MFIRGDDFAILDTRRAGSFARHAFQTKIHMLSNFRSELGSAIGNRAPKIDAPSRAIIFIACFDIGRARTQTKTAVHAVHESFIINISSKALFSGKNMKGKGIFRDWFRNAMCMCIHKIIF
jgi:hypothetical protein